MVGMAPKVCCMHFLSCRAACEAAQDPKCMTECLQRMPAGDEEYDGFVLRHGRRHRGADEYHARRQVYYENKGRIELWNAAGSAAHE
jgi:hypothetical protein